MLFKKLCANQDEMHVAHAQHAVGTSNVLIYTYRFIYKYVSAIYRYVYIYVRYQIYIYYI